MKRASISSFSAAFRLALLCSVGSLTFASFVPHEPMPPVDEELKQRMGEQFLPLSDMAENNIGKRLHVTANQFMDILATINERRRSEKPLCLNDSLLWSGVIQTMEDAQNTPKCVQFPVKTNDGTRHAFCCKTSVKGTPLGFCAFSSLLDNHIKYDERAACVVKQKLLEFLTDQSLYNPSDHDVVSSREFVFDDRDKLVAGQSECKSTPHSICRTYCCFPLFGLPTISLTLVAPFVPFRLPFSVFLFVFFCFLFVFFVLLRFVSVL